MARSNYIYLVFRNDGALLRAFTVKWEMRAWIEKNPGAAVDTVIRIRDGMGHSDDPVELDVSEWVPEGA